MSATAEAVQSARHMLNAAIRAGKDTLVPRKELTAAEEAAEKQRALSDKILAQAEAARAAAIQKEVNAECAKLRDDILAECNAALPGFDVGVVVESHRLVQLLEAKGRADEIAAARAELENDIANLQIRLAEVQTQIDALHAKPDRSEADNGQAHFLLLDKADIEALVTAAQAQLDELTLPDMADLERAWRHAQMQARFGARAKVMLELENRLLNLATEARDTLGPGQSPDLRYRPCALMRQAAQATIV